MNSNNKLVTVIYYDEDSLILNYEVVSFPYSGRGRVELPVSFKQGKTIVAVCEGAINVLNTLGERIAQAPSNALQPVSLQAS